MVTSTRHRPAELIRLAAFEGAFRVALEVCFGADFEVRLGPCPGCVRRGLRIQGRLPFFVQSVSQSVVRLRPEASSERVVFAVCSMCVGSRKVSSESALNGNAFRVRLETAFVVSLRCFRRCVQELIGRQVRPGGSITFAQGGFGVVS